MLDAINARDLGEYRNRRDAAVRRHSKGEELKIDTIFRASLGFLSRRARSITATDRAFLWDSITSRPDLMGSMNAQQCLSL